MTEKLDLDALKREGFAAQRRAGVNVDWFTWQIAWRDAIESRASQPGSGEDAARLDFLASHEAWVAWSKDGEVCRIFHRNEEGDIAPIMGWKCPWFDNARAAIDAARAALAGREG